MKQMSRDAKNLMIIKRHRHDERGVSLYNRFILARERLYV